MQRSVNSTTVTKPAHGLKTGWYLAVTVIVAVLAVITLCALPHGRRLRFNAVHDSSLEKVGWIFDRVTYDPEPIDVVFFGSSRMVFGIDSERVEKSYQARTGKPLRAANLAVQHPGRNLPYLVARETLANKHPRLIVVEIDEREARSLHPAFYEYADVADLAFAPLVVNPTYFSDLAHLPARQLSLFAKTYFPGLMGVRATFDPKRYRGHHWDDTLQETGSPDYPLLNQPKRTQPSKLAELASERIKDEREDQEKLSLPGPLQPLETRANDLYLDALLQLAKNKNVPVRFLYLPRFGADSLPQRAGRYEQRAPIWTNQAVFQRPQWRSDVNHLNRDGAEALSAWIGEQLADQKQLADQNWK